MQSLYNSDIYPDTGGDGDRKPVDDGVAEEGRKPSDPGYVRGPVSVPAFAGTGGDSKSLKSAQPRAYRDYSDIGPES